MVSHAENGRVLEFAFEDGDMISSVAAVHRLFLSCKLSKDTISELHGDSEKQGEVFLDHLFLLLACCISHLSFSIVILFWVFLVIFKSQLFHNFVVKSFSEVVPLEAQVVLMDVLLESCSFQVGDHNVIEV